MHIGEARSFIARTAGALRSDPDPASLFVWRGCGRHAEPARELHLHSRGDRRVPRPPGAGRVSLDHALAEAAAARHAEAVRHDSRGLEGAGIADPGARLALIRSWKTTTLIVKNGAFTATEIAKLKDFATGRSFDLAYYPGIRAEEINRYNILERPYFFEAAAALVGLHAEEYIESYKFAIAPATDDRPYFYDFFKWRFLPELLSLRTQGAAAMLDMGYLVLFATLIQAALLSLLLILAPLAIRRRRFGGTALKARTSAYFLALGLAFLFIEIAYIQRFILFLGHPLYAVAVVLTGFLVFAGGGSALAPCLDRALRTRHQGRRLGALEVAVAGISGVAVLHFLLVCRPCSPR